MDIAYTAKATSDITCIADTDAGQWTSEDPDLHVRVRGERTEGVVVIEGVMKPEPPRDRDRRKARTEVRSRQRLTGAAVSDCSPTIPTSSTFFSPTNLR